MSEDLAQEIASYGSSGWLLVDRRQELGVDDAPRDDAAPEAGRAEER